MIKYKYTILEDFFIDPVTAIITNSKGEIQKTYIHRGRPCFKGHSVHQWQMHTNFGAQNMDIHHLDGNKFNNSLSNLVYLNRNEHTKIHHKGKHNSEETKQKMSKAIKGKRSGMFGKHHSEETKLKIGKALKGKSHSEETKLKLSATMKGKNKDRIWINNGVISKMLKCNEEIPENFVRGRLKNK